jgi:hypothetical protein
VVWWPVGPKLVFHQMTVPPKLVFHQMTVPVPEIMDGSLHMHVYTYMFQPNWPSSSVKKKIKLSL